MKLRWKKLLSAPFVFIAVIVILIEDWLWDDLARLAAAIGRLPIFRQIESLIISLPPSGALAMFAAPSLLLIPVKLAALWFISHGQPTMGFLTAVAAKFAGTALVARIFILTRPKLMSIGWFAKLYERFTSFKQRIYAAIKNTRLYKIAHHHSQRIRMQIRMWRQKQREQQGFWQRKWEAAVRLRRRWKEPQP
jgi:hypothetical protein